MTQPQANQQPDPHTQQRAEQARTQEPNVLTKREQPNNHHDPNQEKQ